MDWIETYLEYTARQVSPRVFHLWSAVAVIAAVLERRCWFHALGGKVRIYPGQMMVVLVSKSAITKKTTAATIAFEFTKVLEPWQLYTIPAKTSPQELLHGLQRLDEDSVPMRDPEGRRVNSAGFVFARELGSFFTAEAFNETLATQVNLLNDCPRGKVELRFRKWQADLWQPCITILGCITPRGIAEELPRAARQAGFFGRILWVHRDHTERKASLLDADIPFVPALRKTLEKDLQSIAMMRGEFTVTKQARKWFNSWYHDTYVPWLVKADLPETEQTGYWGRKDAHLFRVAMVKSASHTRSRCIHEADFVWALKALEDIERSFPAAMIEVGSNPYMDYERKYLEAIERLGDHRRTGGSPWITAQRLQKALARYGGAKRFWDATDTLRGAGEIEVRRREGVREMRRVMTLGRMLRGVEEEQPS